jgi:hypothetical protein
MLFGMPERFRSSAARDLVVAIREAGGTVERRGQGKLVVTGPKGTVTIAEPGGETRRDLRRGTAGQVILKKTGLELA